MWVYRLKTVCVLLPVIAVFTVVLGTLSLLVGPFDRDGRMGHAFARTWAYLILVVSGVRVETRGHQRLVPGATYVFVSNHQSAFDIPVLFWRMPYEIRIIAKESLGRVPFVGWHLRRAGHILVDRAHPDRSAILDRWRSLVTRGLSLIVFPEGTRSATGRVARFKAGSFMLAIDAGLPVVPISVSGTRDVMPKGVFAARPGTVVLTIHDPVRTDTGRWAPTIEDARLLAEEVRQVIAADVAGGLPETEA